jgi:hypothetical protein
LDAWSSREPGRLLARMTPDGVYDDSAWPVTMRGHDDVRHFLAHSRRAFPDMRFEIIEGRLPRRERQRGAAVARNGTMTGPLDPPGLAPTGKKWRVEERGPGSPVS